MIRRRHYQIISLIATLDLTCTRLQLFMHLLSLLTGHGLVLERARYQVSLLLKLVLDTARSKLRLIMFDHLPDHLQMKGVSVDLRPKILR